MRVSERERMEGGEGELYRREEENEGRNSKNERESNGNESANCGGCVCATGSKP